MVTKTRLTKDVVQEVVQDLAARNGGAIPIHDLWLPLGIPNTRSTTTSRGMGIRRRMPISAGRYAASSTSTCRLRTRSTGR